MALVLHENTMTQLLAAFRERFRDSEKDGAAKLAAWLLYHLDTNDIDEKAVREAFGITPNQWNALVKKMKSVAAAYAIVQDARGE